jgi:hypothetical protein
MHLVGKKLAIFGVIQDWIDLKLILPGNSKDVAIVWDRLRIGVSVVKGPIGTDVQPLRHYVRKAMGIRAQRRQGCYLPRSVKTCNNVGGRLRLWPKQ